MKKSTLVLTLVLGGTLLAGAGGAAAWWLLPHGDAKAAATAAAPRPAEPQDWRYVTLDKVIVMLRGGAGEPLTNYVAVDLVFRTSPKLEKATKAQLPLLRSITVQALSSYTLQQAGLMTIEQFTAALNEAYAKSYATDGIEKPFVQAMVGKLIIE
ncbi:flagellar basal body-associated FliL family protein [Caldimonas brevitalea]|uniref:Flagellar FliL protein n=1 Tax=Caldimonas brevitalea TaxID=413882 RepID=A0A0G3BSK5_9BURK|nr:flagellar basal body-associated FliL family protein [Caldimonas brevitalea]AKJ30361.1 flagellar FliL protein [Caldimonas brevitalea]